MVIDGNIHFSTITDDIQQILNKQFSDTTIPCHREDKSRSPTCPTPPHDSIAGTSNSSNSTTEKHWSRAPTLCLIDTWKELEPKLKSTTIKNDQV